MKRRKKEQEEPSSSSSSSVLVEVDENVSIAVEFLPRADGGGGGGDDGAPPVVVRDGGDYYEEAASAAESSDRQDGEALLSSWTLQNFTGRIVVRRRRRNNTTTTKGRKEEESETETKVLASSTAQLRTAEEEKKDNNNYAETSSNSNDDDGNDTGSAPSAELETPPPPPPPPPPTPTTPPGTVPGQDDDDEQLNLHHRLQLSPILETVASGEGAVVGVGASSSSSSSTSPEVGVGGTGGGESNGGGGGDDDDDDGISMPKLDDGGGGGTDTGAALLDMEAGLARRNEEDEEEGAEDGAPPREVVGRHPLIRGDSVRSDISATSSNYNNLDKDPLYVSVDAAGASPTADEAESGTPAEEATAHVVPSSSASAPGTSPTRGGKGGRQKSILRSLRSPLSLSSGLGTAWEKSTTSLASSNSSAESRRHSYAIGSSAHSSNVSDDGSTTSDHERQKQEGGPTPRSGSMSLSRAGRALVAANKFRGKTLNTLMRDGGSDKEGSDKDVGKGKWGLFLTLNSLNKKIPSKVRHARSRRSDRTSAASTYVPPSRLHQLCGDPEAKLEDLQAELAARPEAASLVDSVGRLPLHILGDNDGLMSTSLGRATVTAFGYRLMKAFPEGLTTVDSAGFMPFVALIKDWESWLYETDFGKSKANTTSTKTATSLKDRVVGVVADTVGTVSATLGNSDPIETPLNENGTLSNKSMSKLFPRIEVWDEVEFCFDMLSLAMDELGGKNGGLHEIKTKRTLEQTNNKDDEARAALAAHLPTVMKSILKTLLLVEDEGGEMRKRLLRSSIVRRVFLCPQSVGGWLAQMLRSKGLPSKRAIDYLVLVSKANVDDYVGGFRSVLTEDVAAFEEARERVFSALDELPGVVASLAVLDATETERAASTSILWHIMNKNLARPFVLSLVLIDLVLHVTLLMAFRADVSVYVGDQNFTSITVPTQVVYFITAHYIIRKVCESLAVLTMSLSVFKGYILNMWTLFDTLAIILTLAAMSWNDSHPGQYRAGLNSLVIGLLWIKVLGFLKVVNKEMSTFILALIQILWDLRYFAIVLVVVIFMFADMMRIAVSNKVCFYCAAACADPPRRLQPFPYRFSSSL